jgi:transcription antitermination factor NusG
VVKVHSNESDVHWYCVRTKPKKERLAAANVASMLSLEVFCPQIRFRRKTVRGPVWFQEAMFPGYVFVRFNLRETMRSVAHAPGILNIPVFGGRHIPVPDAVIHSIQDDLDEEGLADTRPPIMAGDEVTLLEGSMRGLKVKVIKVLPAEDRVRVLLEMLGTLVETEVSTDALAPDC